MSALPGFKNCLRTYIPTELYIFIWLKNTFQNVHLQFHTTLTTGEIAVSLKLSIFTIIVSTGEDPRIKDSPGLKKIQKLDSDKN